MAIWTKESILESAKNEGVNFIRLMFADLFGVIKNVEIPVSQYEKFGFEVTTPYSSEMHTFVKKED